jgi:hypothetical protein
VAVVVVVVVVVVVLVLVVLMSAVVCVLLWHVFSPFLGDRVPFGGRTISCGLLL